VIADIQGSVARTVIEAMGGGATGVVRATHSLRYRGSAPTTLTLSAAALVGAASVTFSAAGMTGSLPDGCKLTFANHATEYSVALPASVSSGALTVALTPVLTAAVSDDEVATIAQPYASHTYRVARSRRLEADDQRDASQVGATFHLYPLGDAPAPREEQVFEGLGTTGAILNVKPIGSAGAVAYRVTLGEVSG
jgi:hypothetical protein